MYADILILGQLLSGPKHGYEIKKNVQEALGDSFEINNNLLYPALRRFMKIGAMTKEIEKSDGKPDRHVYLLTRKGEEVFDELIRDFPGKAAANPMEFLVRVALFDRLEPELRLDILRKRMEVLEEEMERTRRFDRGSEQNRFVAEVIRFRQSQSEQELEWVKRLMHEVEAPASGSNSNERI